MMASLLVVADADGATKVADALDGRELFTNRPQSGPERITNGVVGTVQVVLTVEGIRQVSGLAAAKAPNAPKAQITSPGNTPAPALGNLPPRVAPKAVDRGVPHPSTPVGRSGNPLGSVGPNQPTTIGGRAYIGHAIDQMQARGISPSVVENTIQHGVPGRPQPVGSGTTSHFDPVNNITVITDTASGRVVTVFPGR